MTLHRALLLYPHQLFLQLPTTLKLPAQAPVFLLEDPLFFEDSQYPARFHVQRLLFHRLSMQRFQQALQAHGYTVELLPCGPDLYERLQARLQAHGVTALCVPEPSDDVLVRRLNAWCQRQNWLLTYLDSPGFLNTFDAVQAAFSGKKYSQTSFYIAQRKARGILLHDDGAPRGGKWSFDPENRKRLPKGHRVPPLPAPVDLDTAAVQVCFEGVVRDFPKALGQAAFKAECFLYPTTHAGAEAWLQDFLRQRLAAFGDFEDAISQQEAYLYHSLLSPLLNTGLLTPQQVLESALDYAAGAEAEGRPVPLNALEGFVRQIVGWREYMRALYLREGVHIRNQNFWGHIHPMPEALYTGTTGLLPVDHVIQKLQRTAYAHHIERLMILGNFMCLCEIHPMAVYTWFMEYFIDAYDWVMVPNVYSMSQFADGGLLTTKPYISGSNYLRKMGDYPKGEWCDLWDSLYWRFIHKHQAFFAQNYRLRMMVSHLQRMGDDKLQAHLQRANGYLAQLHGA